MPKFEMESFQIILHSGNAKSSAYEALELVKKGDIEKGQIQMKEAKDELLIAQKEHAKILQQFAMSEETEYAHLLLVHAEDHVTSSQLAVSLIGEMIEMYERFGRNER